MKHVNFIATLSLKQHRTLRVWWYFSCVVLFGVLFVIAILESRQLYALYKTMSEGNYLQEQMQTVGSTLEPYKALKTEEESLRMQRTTIDRIHTAAEQLHTLFVSLYPTEQGVRIQSSKITQTQGEFVLECPSVATALNEVKRLRAIKQLHDVQLVSLQQVQNNTHMIAIIQAKVNAM